MLKPLRWYLSKYGHIFQKCDWVYDYDEWCAGFKLEVEWCADENSFGLEKSGVRQNVKSELTYSVPACIDHIVYPCNDQQVTLPINNTCIACCVAAWFVWEVLFYEFSDVPHSVSMKLGGSGILMQTLQGCPDPLTYFHRPESKHRSQVSLL